jgi:hypothetical protein
MISCWDILQMIANGRHSIVNTHCFPASILRWLCWISPKIDNGSRSGQVGLLQPIVVGTSDGFPSEEGGFGSQNSLLAILCTALLVAHSWHDLWSISLGIASNHEDTTRPTLLHRQHRYFMYDLVVASQVTLLQCLDHW